MSPKNWFDPEPPIASRPDEEWRPAPGHERFYSVSSEGRLWSWLTEKLLTPVANKQGVMQVYLRGEKFMVPHLVLTTFVGSMPPGHFAAYKDDAKTNCALSNLYWRSRADLQREVMAKRPPRTHCREGHELTGDNVLRTGKRTRCLLCRPFREVLDA